MNKNQKNNPPPQNKLEPETSERLAEGEPAGEETSSDWWLVTSDWFAG